MTQLYRASTSTILATAIACILAASSAVAADDGDATGSSKDATSAQKRRADDVKEDALKEITVLAQRTTPEIARAAQRQAPNLINLTTAEEMQTCIPYLHEQIDLIRPKVIVALGGTAVEGLLGKTIGITKLRGQWRTYRGIPLMPTYHPAYLLRNQALSEKRRVWEDMLQVMEKLGLPISQKQHDYFLKATG